MEGSRISWDELPCIGYNVTADSIKKLLDAINNYRRVRQGDSGAAAGAVSIEQLLNWNILRSSADGFQATNAFALLAGDSMPFARTQCAVFAGNTRGEFLDKREYSGPLFEQIEQATEFVLRNIRLGARVEGLVRREKYELPYAAIRELIVNAQCHRNFLEPSCVQVAIYTDRLEVTSPGGMFFGLTLDEALQGRSKQRNRAIAVIFSQMGLIEGWGTGLQKVQALAREYGLPQPQFLEMPSAFRVNLYRKPQPSERLGANLSMEDVYRLTGADGPWMLHDGYGKETYDTNPNTDSRFWENFSTTEQRLLQLIMARPRITITQMAEQSGLSRSGVQYAVEKLKRDGWLRRVGAQKNGRWQIVMR